MSKKQRRNPNEIFAESLKETQEEFDDRKKQRKERDSMSIEDNKRKAVNFSPSVDEQKLCNPGPNVKFSKGALPFSEYLSNYTEKGTLGCPTDKFPNFIDGKYCCSDSEATPREKLDYVNMLLESARKNVSASLMPQQAEAIATIILEKEKILTAHPHLIDKLDWSLWETVNEFGITKRTPIKTWFEQALKLGLQLKVARTKPDIFGGKTKHKKRTHKNKTKKMKK